MNIEDIYFDPSKTYTKKAINIERIFPSWLRNFALTFFNLVLVFVLVMYFIPIEGINIDFKNLKLISIVSFCFFVSGSLFLFNKFINQKLKDVKPNFSLEEVVRVPFNFNLADVLDFEAAKCLSSVKSSSRFFKNIIYSKDVTEILRRLKLTPRKIEDNLKETFSVNSFPKIKEVIFEAVKIANSMEFQTVSTGFLFASFLKFNPLKNEFLKMNIKSEDIEYLAFWWEENKIQRKIDHQFWLKENLLSFGAIGETFSVGFTPNLDLYSIDWTKKYGFNPIFHFKLHQNSLSKLEESLVKEASNCVLLVGEPGVGQEEVILELTKKVAQGKSFNLLNYKRVLELNMPKIIAEGKEKLFSKIQFLFEEAIVAGNVILYIPDIHNYIGLTFGVEEIAKVDISGVLLNYLSYQDFRLIGTTTYEGLHGSIDLVREISSQFQKIELSPATEKETIFLLLQRISKIENKNKIFIPYLTIKEIIEVCSRYIGNLPFPQKAFDLLEQSLIFISRYGKKRELTPDIIDLVATSRLEVPIGKIGEKEKETLLNLEELIHRRLVNQDEAVKEVVAALQRARADITRRDKPIGSFLFLGPTGVGKTEAAKALAENYFGSEKAMIRVDMSEFQTPDSITRFIGTINQGGYFTDQVRETPFSLILLDEIEKADFNILNLFLQVLDEGRLTDGMGRLVDFRNTIIIGTSNAGAELIRQAIKDGRDLTLYKEEFIDEILKRGIFKPEFLNRFDAVVLFRTLTKEYTIEIAKIKLNTIKKDLEDKHGIKFSFSDKLAEKIVEIGFDPVFGGRELNRAIQDKIENSIAKAILEGRVKSGFSISFNPETLELIIQE
ncbi:MAG: AAA family ATPase [Candidatus Pacebacteria bacterium]|nr:AAA family ATPase [Candidatus Paceibacterota bacterium]